MTVLVDTGVPCTDPDRDATRYEAASDALEALSDGKVDTPGGFAHDGPTARLLPR